MEALSYDVFIFRKSSGWPIGNEINNNYDNGGGRVGDRNLRSRAHLYLVSRNCPMIFSSLPTAKFCELLGVGGGVEEVLPRFSDWLLLPVGHHQDLPGQLTHPLTVCMRIQRRTVTCLR